MIKDPLHLSEESTESSHKIGQFGLFSQNSNNTIDYKPQLESQALDFPEDNSPINGLIRKYFGFQTRGKSILGGVFGAYLKERAVTFKLRDDLVNV